MTKEHFRFGDWEVSRSGNSVQRGDERLQMEPRAMDVLVTLCKRANEVLSTDELLLACWGSKVYGDNPVHKTIAQLRRLLGDSASKPSYIETIRKRGYRAVAPVSFGEPAARVQAGSWRDGSPFRGLQPFDSAHAAIFFGRETAVRELRGALAGQARAGRPLVLVLGPSGSGKTSLILAGLLPALADESLPAEPRALACAVLDMAEIEDGQLFAGLGAAMLDWQVDGAAVFAGHSGWSLGMMLKSDPAAAVAAIDAALEAHQAGRDQRLLLVLDRFEAIFTQPAGTAAERDAVIAAVDKLARSGLVMVVIGCRNDFYPRIAEYPALMEGKAQGAHFDLERPSQAEIMKMIRLPALAANLTYGGDPDTHERCDELLARSAAAGSDSLPLLQYTLQELYRMRSPGGELTVEAYRRIGGLEGAIGVRAEEVIGAVGEAQREALPRVLALVVTVSADSDSVTSRRARWSALRTEAERDLVTALIDARLFLSELVEGESGFGVAHEALLRRWPRASIWIAHHRDTLQVRARVAQWTARWIEEGRRADLLLAPGKQLDEARGLLGMPEFSLSVQETELIDASWRRSKRGDRIRMGVLAAIAVLAILAVVASLSAFAAKRSAQQRRAEAEGLMEYMLGDLADKLRPLARLDLLDSISAKALEYLSIDDVDDQVSLTNRARALQVIAEVRVARANPKEALSALGAARAILLRQSEANPASWDVVKGLGANAFWQGQIYLNSGDWAQAGQQFTLYRDYSDRLFGIDPGRVEGWVEQSYAHTNLGLLALRRGDSQGAAADFAESIALKQRALATRRNDPALSGELANSLSWLASTREITGDLDGALALYDRELEVVSGLYSQAPTDTLWAGRMASALQRRGKLFAVMGHTQGAEMDLERAEDLRGTAHARDPNNRIVQASLAIVRLDHLRLQLAQGKGNDAMARLTALSAEAGSLTRLDPRKQDWTQLSALIDQTIGSNMLENGRLGEAQRALEDSLAKLNVVLSSNPTDLKLVGDLAKTWLVRSRLHAAMGDRPAQRQDCVKARDTIGKLAAKSADYRILDPWVRAQACLGNETEAGAAQARLKSMGYRDAAYLRAMASRH